MGDQPVEANARWRALAHQHITESAAVISLVADAAVDSIVVAATVIAKCFASGGKLLICGNGGSAAEAQHVAAEFVNRLGSQFEQRPGLPAIALTTDTSFLTAFANDCGYDGVFERQVATFGNRGDVLFALSTSGSSVNVIRAVATARERGLVTIALSGDGGELREKVDHAVIIPSRDTQHIQESSLAVEHSICAIVEHLLFGDPALNV